MYTGNQYPETNHAAQGARITANDSLLLTHLRSLAARLGRCHKLEHDEAIPEAEIIALDVAIDVIGKQ